MASMAFKLRQVMVIKMKQGTDVCGAIRKRSSFTPRGGDPLWAFEQHPQHPLGYFWFGGFLERMRKSQRSSLPKATHHS